MLPQILSNNLLDLSATDRVPDETKKTLIFVLNPHRVPGTPSPTSYKIRNIYVQRSFLNVKVMEWLD